MLLRNLLRPAASGRPIYGTPDIGLDASQIISETATGDQGPGLLYNEAQAQTGRQLRVKVTSWSGTAGSLFVFENGALLIDGQADGAYAIGYDWEAWDGTGVITGSDTASVQIGPVNATAPATTVTGTGTISAGTASGEVNATAPETTVTGTGSITAGNATGEQNATAPETTVTGTGTISAGVATGDSSIDATAPATTVTGTGSISAGIPTVGSSGDAIAPETTITGAGTISAGVATGEQNATAPATTVTGTGTIDAGNGIGDHDATAPETTVTGSGTISAGLPTQQSPADIQISAQVVLRLNLRSGIKPAMQTIVGNTARIHISLMDDTDQPIDADQITIKVWPPGSITEESTPVKDGLGQYHHDVQLTRAGKWYWRVETSNPISSASEGMIDVQPSRFVH